MAARVLLIQRDPAHQAVQTVRNMEGIPCVAQLRAEGQGGCQLSTAGEAPVHLERDIQKVVAKSSRAVL